MERPIPCLGEQFVRAHHRHRIVVLDGNRKVIESGLFEQPGLVDGRLDQRLRRGLAVLLQQARIERARVNADAHRRAVRVSGRGDLRDLVIKLLDISRIHAHAHAGVDRGEHVARLEMDVGHHGNRGLLGDDRQGVGVLIGGARNAHDVTASGRQFGDLLEGCADVVRLRRRHRLDAHRGVATHINVAHLDLAGLLARAKNLRLFFHGRDTKRYRIIHASDYVTLRSVLQWRTPRQTTGLTMSATTSRTVIIMSPANTR